MGNSFNMSSRTSENTVNHLASTKTVSKLAEKLHHTCNALLGALEWDMDGISSYGQKVTEKVMTTKFVDRVISNTMLLQRHLRDMKKLLEDSVLSQEQVVALIAEFDRIKMTFVNYVQEDGFFRSTFGYLVEEITETITKIVEKIDHVAIQQANTKNPPVHHMMREDSLQHAA